MSISVTPIASTQKAGEGDAVILPRISNQSAIDLMAAEKRRKDTSDFNMQRMKKLYGYKQKEDVLKRMQDIRSKIWFRDEGRIRDYIRDNIVTPLRDNYISKGINPFEDDNAMLDINSALGNLSAMATASKSAETVYNKAREAIDKDTKDIYDKPSSYRALDDWANSDWTKRSTGEPALVETAFSPNVYMDKTFGDNVGKLFPPLKIFYDSGLTEKADEYFKDLKTKWTPVLAASLLNDSRGSIKDPNEAIKTANEWLDANASSFIGFDPTQKNKLDFQKQKERNLTAYRNSVLGLKKDYLAFRESQSMPPQFYTKDIITDALVNNNPQAISLIRNYYTTYGKGSNEGVKNGNYFDVTKGINLLDGSYTTTGITDNEGKDVNEKLHVNNTIDVNGKREPIHPNENYVIRIDGLSGKRFITKVSPAAIKTFTEGDVGKALEKRLVEDKASNFSYNDDYFSDIPITSKTSSSVQGKSGSTNMNRNSSGGLNTQPKQQPQNKKQGAVDLNWYLH